MSMLCLLCSIDYLRFPYYYCEVVIISNSVQVQLLFVFWGCLLGVDGGEGSGNTFEATREKRPMGCNLRNGGTGALMVAFHFFERR